MRPLRKATAIATLAALVFACGKAKSQQEAVATAADYREHTVSRAEPTPKGASGPTTPKPADAPGFVDVQMRDDRKIIRTGHISLVVATYDDARAKIDALVQQAGGYVDSTQVNRRQDAISDATIVVRIPSTAFGSLLPKLREIGEIVSESTNAADITDQYVDIAARLASSKALEKRLLELATDKSGNIEQVLAVERELSRVRTEVESYEGRMRQWNDQIAMSTLTLSLATKRPEIVAAAEASLGTRTKQAFNESIGSLRDFGSWLVINGIAFLPWLLLLIPALVFGRRFARRFIKLPTAIARTGEPPVPPAA